jgi:hypothetical protein
MNYTMADGTVIDLNDVYEISPIRDYGQDTATIDENILSFTIRLKSSKSIKVSLNYHFNESSSCYRELKKYRDELMQKWQDVKNDSE